MTERDILIAGIVALWAGIAALVIYIKSLHEKHSKDQKETIESVTKEVSKSTTALEHNTRAFDMVIKHIEKSTKR